MGYRSSLLVIGLAMMALTAPSAPAGGEEVLECFGMTPTIIGTQGDDVLTGSEDEADVIVGLGGNDTIRGSGDINAHTAPGDRLCGGSGEDYIRGAVGEDRIQGGPGADDVDGSFGFDVITQGGQGHDRVTDCDSEYTGGVRIIKGNGGNDHLCVDVDPSKMYGNAGSDVLKDLDCTDETTMRGGPGADRLESYFANFEGDECSDVNVDVSDDVLGGTGTDQAIVSPNDDVRDVEDVEVR